MGDLITTREAAAILGICKARLSKWKALGRGLEPAMQIGRNLMFRRCDVEAIAAARRNRGKSEKDCSAAL